MKRVCYLCLLPAVALLTHCSNSSESEAPGKRTHNAGGGLALTDAFTQYVHPVLKANCVPCHQSGAYPFAVSNSNEAFKAASSMIGVNKINSRFYNKLKQGTHPTQEVAEKTFPQMDKALDIYFSSIAASQGDGNFITLKPKSLADATSGVAEVSNVGLLLYELEGSTVVPNTKFEVKNGGFSNNFGVASKPVPNHPQSGEPRTYNTDTCQDSSPTIMQPAHLVKPNGEVIAKRLYNLEFALLDPEGEEIENINFDFDLLPDNYPPQANVPDSVYTNEQTIISDIATARLTAEQINIIKSLSLKEIAERMEKLDPNRKKHQALRTILEGIEDSLNTGTGQDVLKHFSATSTYSTDKTDLEYYTYNAETMQAEEAKIENIHQRENVPLAEIDDEFKNQGKATLSFKVNPELAVQLGLDTPGAPIPFRVLTRGKGQWYVRLVDSSSQVIEMANDECQTFDHDQNNGGSWRRQNNARFELTPGEYTFEFYQKDEESALDAIMLVANTNRNETIDPDSDPRKLRHQVYGLSGGGVQKPIQKLEWKILGDQIFSIEVEPLGTVYAVQNPQILNSDFKMSNSYRVKGVDFLVNRQLAVTDKNFSLKDVLRPSHSTIAYGKVLLPQSSASGEDGISPRFEILEKSSGTPELPKYVEAPPVQGISCRAPGLFEEIVMPLYTQQKVVIRQEEDNENTYVEWSKNSPDYLAYNEDDEIYETMNQPTLYTCTTCHDENHPFFPMATFDAETLCNEVLSRTNRDFPSNSIAMRGLRGQLGHRPLYSVFDPFKEEYNRAKNRASLEEIKSYMIKGQAGDESFIYGKMLGIFATPSADMSTVADGDKKEYFSTPLRISFDSDPFTETPMLGTEADLAPGADEGDAVFKFAAEAEDILSQHNRVVERWENNFFRWVKEENRLLEEEQK